MNKRPRIKVPYQTVDVFLEFLSITLLILIFGYTIYEYNTLPETIPTHFNAKGEADGFSSKQTLWLIPTIAIIMYIGIFIINLYPYKQNYIVNITKENAYRNYRFSTRMVRFVNLFSMVILGIVTFKIVTSARGESANLESWFLPLIIIISILLPIVILLYQKRINRE
jgi:uncharacterized membrane protein